MQKEVDAIGIALIENSSKDVQDDWNKRRTVVPTFFLFSSLLDRELPEDFMFIINEYKGWILIMGWINYCELQREVVSIFAGMNQDVGSKIISF